MSEATANLWTLDELMPRKRRAGSPLAIGLLIGALIGCAITVLVTGPIESAPARESEVGAREWRKRPLELEWRGYKTPVDVDRMFRKRR